jgi:uncharacterized membrane protein
MSKRNEVVSTFLLGLAVAIGLYTGVAWFVFEWRNPLCNETAFYRNFTSVMSFKRLPQYQHDE